MNRRRFLVGIATLVVAGAAGAQDGGRISPDQAAAIAARRTGGQVLSVQWDEGRGRYRVRVLESGGRVRTVDVDGRGG